MQEKKVKLFKDRDEAINVYGLIFFIPFIFIELFTQTALKTYENAGNFLSIITLVMQPMFRGYSHWGNFIVGFIFLNVTHIIFTYIACAELGVFKRFLTDKLKYLNLYILIGLSIIFFGYSFITHYIQTDAALYEQYKDIFALRHLILLAFIYGAFHVRKQTMGFFLLYNQKLRSTFQLTEEESKKVTRLEKIERLLFIPIVWHPFLAVLVIFFENEAKVMYGSFIRFLPLLPALGLIAISRMYPYAKQSNKFLFSLRIIFAGLAPYSFVAGLLERAHHGIEYYYIIKDFYGKVFGGLTKAFYIGGFLYAAIASFTPYTDSFFRLLYEKPSEMGFFMFTVSWIVPALHLLHFYFDGVLFRFKDPLVRKHILPLLS